MDHWERCKASVLAYAADLHKAVRNGALNESAVEGLIGSYLTQPAFYPEWYAGLLKLALAECPDDEAGHNYDGHDNHGA